MSKAEDPEAAGSISTPAPSWFFAASHHKAKTTAPHPPPGLSPRPLPWGQGSGEEEGAFRQQLCPVRR